MSVTGDETVNAVYPGLQGDLQASNESVGAPVRKSQKSMGNNGSLDLPGKIENLKSWSSTAMKCTKQAIEEKLGTSSPTRDPEIDTKIDELKRMQAKYQEINVTVKKIISHMTAAAALERSLSSQLTIAAQHQLELNDEFAQNAEIQRVTALSMDDYIMALNLFCDGLDTFCKKTVPDTLATIRQLEHARLVYDAYRNDLARTEAKAAGRTASTASTAPITPTPSSKSDSVATNAKDFSSTSSTTSAPPQLELSTQQVHQKFTMSKEAYLALKKDTDVKMKLLHENRTRVIRKHLTAMKAATLSYFASASDALNESLKALKERHDLSDSQNKYEPSFLEAESPSPFTKHPSVQQQQKPVYFTPTENGDTEDGEEEGKRDVFQD